MNINDSAKKAIRKVMDSYATPTPTPDPVAALTECERARLVDVRDWYQGPAPEAIAVDAAIQICDQYPRALTTIAEQAKVIEGLCEHVAALLRPDTGPR